MSRPPEQYPSHWQTAKLGDITTRITSGSRDWKPYYGQGNGVFVLTQNVRMRALDLSEPFQVGPPEDDPAAERSAVLQDDLLLNIVGAVGTVARVPAPLPSHYVCQSVALIRPALPTISRWLELYMAAPAGGQTYFREKTYGMGRPHLGFADIKAMPIPLPPIDEQEAIAAEVDRLLADIGTGASYFTSAQQSAAGFQSSLLQGTLYGDLAGGPFPQRRVGDVCEVRAGVGFPKSMQGRTAGDFPFAKVRDISSAWNDGDTFLATAENYVASADLPVLKGNPLPAGTVAMAKIGEAVRLNRRVILACEALVDNNVMGWVPNQEMVLPKFLYYFSQTVDLGTWSQATAVPSVRKSDVVEIEMPVPSLEEQHRVVEVIETQMAAKDAVQGTLSNALGQAVALQAAVMNQAIAGELVPQSKASGDLVRELLLAGETFQRSARNRRAVLVAE